MSDNKLLIDGAKLVRDAFYAMPDIYDEEGRHIGGVYGALFRMKSLIDDGAYSVVTVNLEGGHENYTEAVNSQAVLFKKVLAEINGFEIDTDNEITDDLKAAINIAIQSLSPTGKVAEAPRFRHALIITSDLTEVEKIFQDALDYGRDNADRYVAYYFIADRPFEKCSKRKTIGMSLCFGDDKAYYIPVSGFITDSYLGEKLSHLSRSVNLSTFDIKESYRVFTPYEIETRDFGCDMADKSYEGLPRCFDVLIGAYLINPLKNDYEPWDVSSEYLKIPLQKKSDLFGKASFEDSDEKTVADYAGKVAYICFAAVALIRKKLVKAQMEGLFYNIEMPLSYILYAMEREGIIAKKEALREYGEKLSVRIEELEKAIYEAAGVNFNINSPKQLGEILFERLGLPADKKTKSGYSTAADVLEKLAPEHRIVADILEYRGLAKLKSTYADGLSAFIEEDERIHTSFNQTITATGRISSTEPNLQNIPMRTELGRLIRKVFVPGEGCVFTDADYSQIELRILAHMSDDEGLISAYHEGDDIHAITASKVFHVPFEEVTPLQRRNAKAVNFGIVYGISSFGLSQDLSISVSEAREYMEKYFETYPGVRAYQDNAILDAKNKGYSVTLFGRRRPIPELKASNFNLKQFGERVAMNAPIQGTAADIMKIAMINVFFKLKKEGLGSKLILQIHDELVIETKLPEKDRVFAILIEEMEKAADLKVPMEVDCHTGSDWYEAK
ncbi:MAG: DNA polymerase I [Butyrivibrio sp.]|nr:DNA polymerase I [Butyrivibrio sp.]